MTDSIGGKPVSIVQRTGYPGDLTVSFDVSVPESVRFTLRVRKPRWANGWHSELPFQQQDGWLVLDNVWAGTTTLQVAFECKPEIYTDYNLDRYYSFGPLVYALPIPSEKEVCTRYPQEGFHQALYTRRTFPPAASKQWMMSAASSSIRRRTVGTGGESRLSWYC